MTTNEDTTAHTAHPAATDALHPSTTKMGVSVSEMTPPTDCVIQYVYENSVVFQEATITPEGDVAPEGGLEIHEVGETYVWCDTHQVIIHAGTTHEGHTLNDEWESV